jgi:hypothetical protein
LILRHRVPDYWGEAARLEYFSSPADLDDADENLIFSTM